METRYQPKSRDEEQTLTSFLVDGTKVGSGGFVKLVDFMGSDEKLVRTARVSTGRGFVSWEPYQRCKNCDYIIVNSTPTTTIVNRQVCNGDQHKWEKFPNGDVGIIHNLVRERHTSPIEFGEITFHLRIPMHIWRQVVRHRTANVSEYSTRYSEAIDEMETTSPHEWRLQATQNRQGSSGYLDENLGSALTENEKSFHRDARELYKHRLSLGVAKEQARKDLPLSNYTEVFWKIDCRNLMHFLGLRLEEHAQKEAREFGQGIATIFKFLFPKLYWAFEEFKLHAVTFSRSEMGILKTLLGVVNGEFSVYFHSFNVEGHPLYGSKNKANRERFLKKFGVK